MPPEAPQRKVRAQAQVATAAHAPASGSTATAGKAHPRRNDSSDARSKPAVTDLERHAAVYRQVQDAPLAVGVVYRLRYVEHRAAGVVELCASPVERDVHITVSALGDGFTTRSAIALGTSTATLISASIRDAGRRRRRHGSRP